MAAPGDVMFYEAVPERAGEMAEKTGAARAASVAEVVGGSDLFFVCVKPDQFAGIAGEIKSAWKKRSPVCATIMAGVKTAAIREKTVPEMPVIRIMPNVACTVRKGVAGLAAAADAPESVNQFVFRLFEELGGAVWVKEAAMDAVTAMSGSGPAYVFMFVEAFTDAGVRIGLDRATAGNLAMRTVAGAAEMMIKSGANTLDLRAQVSSPGGTTVAGTSVLERTGFRSSIIEAVRAAWERSLELGR